MKKTTTSLLPALAVSLPLLFTACNNDRNQDDHNGSHESGSNINSNEGIIDTSGINMGGDNPVNVQPVDGTETTSSTGEGTGTGGTRGATNQSTGSTR